MTTKTDYTGVLSIALNLIPVLNDPKQGHYNLTPNDTPVTVAAKVYDAFLYGLSDNQFHALVSGAKRSPKRAKELEQLKQWADDVTPILDSVLSPADMGQYAGKFADFADPDTAGEDEEVLLASWALVTLAGVKQIPAALKVHADQLLPYVFPDTDEVLGQLFGEVSEASREAVHTADADTARSQVLADEAEAALSALAPMVAADVAADEELDASEALAEDVAQLDAPDEALAQLAEDFEGAQSVDILLEAAEAPAAPEPAVVLAAEERGVPAVAELEGDYELGASTDVALTPPTKPEKAGKAEKAPKPEKAGKAEKAPKPEKVEKAEKAEKAPRQLRTPALPRTGGGTGTMSDMRRLIIINPEISFNDVERVMQAKGVEFKRSTWAPKLSDMRNMLAFLTELGVVDKDKLAALSSAGELAKHDTDLTAEEAAAIDRALAGA